MPRAAMIDAATPSASRASCPIGEDHACGLSCDGRDYCERIAALREAVRAADDELYRISQADDFAMIGGAYERAAQVLRTARRALADAEGRQ